MFGVRQRIVVLLMKVAGDEPNLPNLHLIPYYSKYSPVGGGAGCQNGASSFAFT